MTDFSAKVALLTGAGAGIGRAIAREWAHRGGTAVVTDRDEESANAVVREIAHDGGSAIAMPLDVQDGEAIADIVDKTVDFGGGLDVLFNVAGTNIPRNVEEISETDWRLVFDVNLTAIFLASKYAIPHLRSRGGGAIVNVSSIAGIIAENRCSAYSASKGGVVLLTRNMAMDFARDKIRVNAICPGSTRTPRTEKVWRASSPTGTSEMAQLCPMRRSAEPEEIAKPAVFLASEDASYITGTVLIVDGGMTAGFVIPTFDRA